MILAGIYEQLQIPTSVTSLLANPAAKAIFQIVAMKGAARPYLVLNRTSAPPAEASLDGVTALTEGEIQFDAYADTPQAAQQLIRAVKSYLLDSFSQGGALPDGSTISFVKVAMEHDAGYEEGGNGYLYRVLLRLGAFYNEGP